MVQWEYYVVTDDEPDDLTMVDALNGKGEEGWELVSTLYVGDGQVRYFFKRRIE